VIGETRATLRTIVDAETGLRGYLITGRQEFLEPWKRSNTVTAQFSKVEEMVSDNPAQKQRFIDNHAKFLAWLKYSDGMIRLRESQGNYTDFDRNLEGKRMMDDVRSGFATMVDAEQALRDTRIERADRRDGEFKISLIGLSLVLATTLVLLSRYQLFQLSDQYNSALRTAEDKTELERERKQWFFTLLRSVGDAVIATDAAGQITFINPAAELATGWSEAEAKTQSLEKVFRIFNADTRKIVENPVDKVRRLNTVVGLGNHTILLRKDGTEINIDDSGAPIRNDDGSILGVILIFRDITRQYEMERTLRTTEKLALAGRITASVAHEINNPLDTIGNLLQLIHLDPSKQQAGEYAELASRELHRVNQVIRSMLSLYRESQSPVSVPLADLLRGVLSLLEMHIKGKEAEISCNLLDDAIVEGFPAELRQVFTNLIHNALEAIPQRGKIIIECAIAQTEKDVCVAITDNGSGISEGNMTRLFQHLFTTKGVNGTGLGLWVSKGIIEKHGGSIEARTESASGASGAQFIVILPRRFPTQMIHSQGEA
jgi:PAS domain S-box-containing protein